MKEFKITVRTNSQKNEETYQGTERNAKRHATGLFNQLPFAKSVTVEEQGKEHLPRFSFMKTKWIKRSTDGKWVTTY